MVLFTKLKYCLMLVPRTLMLAKLTVAGGLADVEVYWPCPGMFIEFAVVVVCPQSLGADMEAMETAVWLETLNTVPLVPAVVEEVFHA